MQTICYGMRRMYQPIYTTRISFPCTPMSLDDDAFDDDAGVEWFEGETVSAFAQGG